jgi:hypothetical protein
MVPIGRIACEAQREMARVAPEALAEGFGTALPNTQRRVRAARKGLRAG